MTREDIEWVLLQVELADIEALTELDVICDQSHRGYHCTRLPGHPGIHAAGGSRGRVEKRWPA